MAVVLLGYRGSGKTTVGRLVAGRVGEGFLDTDDLVVRRAEAESGRKRTIAEIFAEVGEGGFRDLEEGAVEAALAVPGCVVSMGGGAVLREGNRRRLVEGAGAGRVRVYLRCEVGELARRLAADPNTAGSRPALLGGGGAAGGVGGAASVEEISRVLAVREGIYREVMTCEIDVTGVSAERVAEDIVGML